LTLADAERPPDTSLSVPAPNGLYRGPDKGDLGVAGKNSGTMTILALGLPLPVAEEEECKFSDDDETQASDFVTDRNVIDTSEVTATDKLNTSDTCGTVSVGNTSSTVCLAYVSEHKINESLENRTEVARSVDVDDRPSVVAAKQRDYSKLTNSTSSSCFRNNLTTREAVVDAPPETPAILSSVISTKNEVGEKSLTRLTELAKPNSVVNIDDGGRQKDRSTKLDTKRTDDNSKIHKSSSRSNQNRESSSSSSASKSVSKHSSGTESDKTKTHHKVSHGPDPNRVSQGGTRHADDKRDTRIDCKKNIGSHGHVAACESSDTVQVIHSSKEVAESKRLKTHTHESSDGKHKSKEEKKTGEIKSGRGDNEREVSAGESDVGVVGRDDKVKGHEVKLKGEDVKLKVNGINKEEVNGKVRDHGVRKEIDGKVRDKVRDHDGQGKVRDHVVRKEIHGKVRDKVMDHSVQGKVRDHGVNIDHKKVRCSEDQKTKSTSCNESEKTVVRDEKCLGNSVRTGEGTNATIESGTVLKTPTVKDTSHHESEKKNMDVRDGKSLAASVRTEVPRVASENKRTAEGGLKKIESGGDGKSSVRNEERTENKRTADRELKKVVSPDPTKKLHMPDDLVSKQTGRDSRRSELYQHLNGVGNSTASHADKERLVSKSLMGHTSRERAIPSVHSRDGKSSSVGETTMSHKADITMDTVVRSSINSEKRNNGEVNFAASSSVVGEGVKKSMELSTHRSDRHGSTSSHSLLTSKVADESKHSKVSKESKHLSNSRPHASSSSAHRTSSSDHSSKTHASVERTNTASKSGSKSATGIDKSSGRKRDEVSRSRKSDVKRVSPTAASPDVLQTVKRRISKCQADLFGEDSDTEVNGVGGSSSGVPPRKIPRRSNKEVSPCKSTAASGKRRLMEMDAVWSAAEDEEDYGRGEEMHARVGGAGSEVYEECKRLYEEHYNRPTGGEEEGVGRNGQVS